MDNAAGMSGAPHDSVVIRLASFPGGAELQAQQGLLMRAELWQPQIRGLVAPLLRITFMTLQSLPEVEHK